MISADIRECDEDLLKLRCPLLVMGVGNILQSDDGVGVHIIETMKNMELPNHVELLDGGTASLSFLDSLSNREKVIIIDAVKGGNKPGTIYRFAPDDIHFHSHMSTSLHQIGIIESLTLSKFLGSSPRSVIIFGIEPGKLEWGMTLSPGVAKVIPKVIELICYELKMPMPLAIGCE